MVDAVASGGYGMLGLDAAQAPAVPEPPPAPPVTSPGAEPIRAAQATPVVQGQGSGPLPGADPGADGSATSGRDFGDSGQAQSRQAAVLASLSGAASGGSVGAGGATGAGVASGNTPTGAASRALRAYDRAGAATSSSAPTGIMLAARA